MTVYVLEVICPYNDPRFVMGIYSTKEKAEEAKAEVSEADQKHTYIYPIILDARPEVHLL